MVLKILVNAKSFYDYDQRELGNVLGEEEEMQQVDPQRSNYGIAKNV